jgi:alkylhydroperoxidase family enzyme
VVTPSAHYDEKGLAVVILMIATTNFCNRINVTVRAQDPPPGPDRHGRPR